MLLSMPVILPVSSLPIIIHLCSNPYHPNAIPPSGAFYTDDASKNATRTSISK